MKTLIITSIILAFLIITTFPVSAGPQSTSYELIEYGFGSGGSEGLDSSSYSLFGTLGEQDTATELSSTNYKTLPGLVFTMMANVPTVTLVNTNNWYNKLLLTIGNEQNPTDSLFAIAVTNSSDNYATTQYVQNDNTLGATLGAEDWQSYSAWGGASGTYIIGLSPDITYKVKVKAHQGDFTETPWSVEATETTSPVTLSFDIDIGTESSAETDAPYSVSLGTLSAGNVTTATDYIWVDISTNAEYGGYVYLYDSYTGLRSSSLNYTISSSTTNLTSATEGYGVRVHSATNISAQSPYNGISENVGVVDTTIREVFHSNSSPVASGRGALVIKAKASTTTPASNDYEDTITLISSGSF